MFFHSSKGDLYHFGNNELGQSGIYYKERLQLEREGIIVKSTRQPWKVVLEKNPETLSFFFVLREWCRVCKGSTKPLGFFAQV